MPAAAPEPERLFDGTLIAARDAPVGGQAVLEGVMMCGVSTWAVAVRAPAPEQVTGGRRLQSDEAALGEIKVQSFPLVSALKRHRVLRLPIIRGVVALGESLKLGFRALNISANAQLPADEEPISGGTWAGYWLFGSRIVGIPLVAGLAFEVIKWFGRNRSKPWVRVLMAPGLKLQLLTTREPDLAQLAVAIAALEAVLAVEKPDEASEVDRIGMEIVA